MNAKRTIIELLEPRIAPASVLLYTDIDGDNVTVKSSVGNLAGHATLSGGAAGQLQLLDLSDPSFAGAKIKFRVIQAAGGDGLAHVGAIQGGANDFVSISVSGDLGQIDAGSGGAAVPAVQSLRVRSMGIYGLATQGVGGSLASDIHGDVGSLRATGDVKDVTMNVSIGGSGGGIGLVKIGGSVVGARISSIGNIGTVKIGGSLIGGASAVTGYLSSGGDMGPVKIGREVQGGAGTNSGEIRSGGTLAGVTIGGSLLGGTGNASGFISSSGAMGAVQIGHDVRGGEGAGSGQISCGGTFTGVAIGGSLTGGSGPNSALISSGGDMDTVTIGRDMLGGGGIGTGYILSSGKLARVTIGGSLLGGPGYGSGLIGSADDLGFVKVRGDVQGGAGGNNGKISSGSHLGVVKIGGDLKGAGISGTMPSLGDSGLILSSGGIASVTIGGSIISGTDTSTSGDLARNGSIRAGYDIGSVVVRGALVGNTTANGDSPVIISAVGQAMAPPTSDVAIGKLTAGGGVAHALILGGYGTGVSAANTAASAFNGNARIGKLAVGGDWIASSIAAGVRDPLNNGFGNADDQIIPGGVIAKIAKITIRGLVIGSGSSGDHSGFVSKQIGSFKSLGFTATLTAGAGNDVIELSPVTGDVTIREI